MLIAGGKLTLYSHICNEWINYYTSRTCFFLKVTIGTVQSVLIKNVVSLTMNYKSRFSNVSSYGKVFYNKCVEV